MQVQRQSPTTPSPLSSHLKSMTADGKISKDEYKKLADIVEQLDASPKDKAALLKIVDKAKDYTNPGLFSDGILENKEMGKLQKLAKKLDSGLANEFLDAFKATAKPTENNSFLGSIFKSIFSAFTGKPTGNPSPAQASPQTDQNQVTPRQSHPTGPLTPSTQFPNRPPVTGATNAPPLSNTPSGEIYEKSPYHDPNKFVPAFSMTAFHESGSHRSKADPYAVGAITKPSRSQDLGGKTYGTYQFESSTYPDGSNAGSNKVKNSTLMRFINDPKNPYGEQLRAAVQQHGVGTPGFDKVWENLALQDNKGFGEAQQQFLHTEKAASVEKFMDAAELAPEVRQDNRIRDLIMGTTNHVGGLAKGVSSHLAQLQRNAGRKLTANEVGQAITDFKKGRVSSWFRSSPGAQAGVTNRFNAERQVFA